MTDATQLPDWQNALNAFNSSQGGAYGDRIASFQTTIGTDVDKFKSQFNSLVGRDPTQDEIGTFVNQFVVPNAGGIGLSSSPIYQDFRNQVTGFIGDTYQQAAKDQATKQLTDLQGQNNNLANMFRTQGNDAINSTEQSLLDYQSKLFEKLRPNLITSLNAQGLLDTGGLNQAMAGAQSDLANSVQPFLANARLNNENAANQIAFSGAAAPTQYAMSNAMNSVPYLQGQGANAVNTNYNTFLTDLNFRNQMALQHQAAQDQQGLQPSFLRTLGQSFATSLGNSGGQWFGPGAQSSSAGGKSGMSGAMALFG